MKQEILEILQKNCRIEKEQIAIMLDTDVETIEKEIKELEESNVIIGYNALVNWEKTEKESVTAVIEVKVTPQRGVGFDSVAERIYKFPQVTACYLMSGGFDLAVFVEGKSMKEVAMFVSEKLATIDVVLSTATHFMLKKYKENSISFEKKRLDDREAVVL